MGRNKPEYDPNDNATWTVIAKHRRARKDAWSVVLITNLFLFLQHPISIPSPETSHELKGSSSKSPVHPILPDQLQPVFIPFTAICTQTHLRYISVCLLRVYLSNSHSFFFLFLCFCSFTTESYQSLSYLQFLRYLSIVR